MLDSAHYDFNRIGPLECPARSGHVVVNCLEFRPQIRYGHFESGFLKAIVKCGHGKIVSIVFSYNVSIVYFSVFFVRLVIFDSNEMAVCPNP